MTPTTRNSTGAAASTSAPLRNNGAALGAAITEVIARKEPSSSSGESDVDEFDEFMAETNPDAGAMTDLSDAEMLELEREVAVSDGGLVSEVGDDSVGSQIGLGETRGSVSLTPCINSGTGAVHAGTNDQTTIVDQITRAIVATERTVADLVIQLATLNGPENHAARELRQEHMRKLSDLANLNKSLDIINKRVNYESLSLKVPNNLPKLQWVSCVADRSQEVFPDLKAALRKFEDVLLLHNYKLDVYWRRLIPVTLSGEHRGWFDEIPATIITWKQFKKAFLDMYGGDADEERASAANALLNIKMNTGEQVDAYVDRFRQLKRKAYDVDTDILINRFIEGLHNKMKEAVYVSLAGWPKKTRRNLVQIISLTKNLDNKVFKKQVDRVNDDDRHVARVNTRGGKSKVVERNLATYHCKMHGVNRTHDTINCMSTRRVVDSGNGEFQRSATGSNASKYATKGDATGGAGVKDLAWYKQRGLCQRCEQNWAPGHRCGGRGSSVANGNTGSRESGLTFRSMKLKVGASQNTGMIHPTIDHLLMNSNLPLSNSEASIFVPITVEGIQVFGMVDCAANFSSVSLALFSRLNKKIVVKNNETIGLAHKDFSVEREGIINNVHLKYNGLEIYHTFEVFDFDSQADVCIGTDLMPLLHINITGLATSWEPYVKAAEDPIDASVNDTQKDYPFGTSEERKVMMDKIEPLLKINKQIPTNSCCTLPGATVELKVDESKYKARRQYPIPYAHKKHVDEQVETWLKDGVIVEAGRDSICFQSPLLVVRKKDLNGDYGNKVRVVLDIRSCNEALIPNSKDTFQTPLIAELHQKMSGKRLFTTLDLTQCYHRFPIHPDSQKYVVFYHNGKQYQFQRAPFGISTVGSIVQRAISRLFADMTEVVNVYIDDVQLSTHDDLDYHTACLTEIIDRLNTVGLILNNDKAHYAQTQVQALGFTMNQNGLSVDPKKIANVHEWGRPTTGKAIQRLLGFASYLRPLIPMYAKITQPLDELRNYGSLATVWADKHTDAFEKLKCVLSNTPVLSPPDFSLPFCVGTDASAFCIGGICYQVVDDQIKYIAFASRVLSKSERNYSTTRRELVSVLFCFSKFRYWLLHAKFHLFTDHRCLLWLNTQNPNTLMLAYYESIFSLDYDITHTPGIYHILPDKISRLLETDENEVVPNTRFYNEHVALQKREGKQVKKDFNQKSKQNVTFKSKKTNEAPTAAQPDADINLFFRSCKISAVNTEMSTKEKDELIMKYHLLGHYGINQVEKSMKLDDVSWPKMRDDIQRNLKYCDPCLSFNTVTRVGYHPPRSENAYGPGQHWGIDLGSFGCTSARGNNFCLVLVDLFSRYVVLRALPDKNAATVALHLVDIMAILGVPKIIQHDNGAEFSNELLADILNHLHIDNRVSNPYNPMGNAVTESFVKSAKMYLMKRFHGADDQWDLYLNAAMIALNMKYSRLHNTRPFSAQFFRAPNMFSDFTKVEPLHVEQIQPKLIEAKIKEVTDLIIPALRAKIEETQLKDHESFKRNHRIVDPYPIGSRVYIENVDRQKKSDKKYLGPYIITNISRGGSYTLQNVATNEIFERDVSTSQINFVSAANVNTEEDDAERFEILAVVDHRFNGDKREYRVKFKGYTDESWDEWLPISHFDSMVPIKKYLQRRGMLDTSNKRKAKDLIKRKAQQTKKVGAVQTPVASSSKAKKRRRRR